MRGLITSERAAKIYRYLDESGPAPAEALEALWGRNKAERALKSLRGAGYVRTTRIRGVEMVYLRGCSPVAEDIARGWFAARLAEAGGWYSASEGKAYFPRGQVYPVVARLDRVEFDKFFAVVEDLKAKPLKDALRVKQHGNFS